jgi:signal peptidase I
MSDADPMRAGAVRPTAKPRWRRALSSPWMHLLAALIVVAIVQALFVKLFQVPSGSMEETLDIGDRVLVNRLAYVDERPETGDVVVFNASETWEPQPERPWWRTAIGWVSDVVGFGPGNHHALAKRVIGTPGDTVACCDIEGRVIVNGVPLDEPYLFEDFPFESEVLDCDTEPQSARCFDAIVLGDDEYLVLGDHRSNSADSVIGCRASNAPPDCARTVRREDFVGEVAAVIFPFSRWGQPLSEKAG